MNENLPNLIDQNSGSTNIWIGEHMTVGIIIIGLAISAGYAVYFFKAEIGDMYQSGLDYVTGHFNVFTSWLGSTLDRLRDQLWIDI